MSHVSDSDYQSVYFESQVLHRQQVFLPLKMWSYHMLILQGAQKVQLTMDDHSSLILFSLNVHQKRPSMANGVVLYLLVLTNRSKSKDVFSDQDDIFPLEIYLPTTGMLRYLNISSLPWPASLIIGRNVSNMESNHSQILESREIRWLLDSLFAYD